MQTFTLNSDKTEKVQVSSLSSHSIPTSVSSVPSQSQQTTQKVPTQKKEGEQPVLSLSSSLSSFSLSSPTPSPSSLLSPETPKFKVLVTGNAGFIGGHTSERLLKRGTAVVGVDEVNDYYDLNQKEHNLQIQEQISQQTGTYYQFYHADICNMALMEKIFAKEKPDVVCHLAARAGVRPSLEDPFLYIQTNIQGTVILLELARKHGVKNFVYASSSSVYGSNTKVPFSESDPVDHPVSQYAATKRSTELMASTYHQLYKLNVTGLRFFTVYGPRGRPDMAPFKFVDRIFKETPIDKYGDGSSCRDYTYIDDIVTGVVSAIDHPLGCEVVNLGNSQVVSLNEFISVVEECVGKKAIIKQLKEQPGDVPITYADCTKAQQLLGYSPQWDIRKGMKSFVNWYIDFQNRENTPLCSSGSDSDNN